MSSLRRRERSRDDIETADSAPILLWSAPMQQASNVATKIQPGTRTAAELQLCDSLENTQSHTPLGDHTPPATTAKMPTYWLTDSQSTLPPDTQQPLQPILTTNLPEVGVAFCSGGVFFLLFGLVLLFDRALLAMGNILFLIGITLLLGPSRTFVFFARRQKWRGSACFWAGVGLILMRWTFVGFAIECVGIFYLFGEYVCPAPGPEVEEGGGVLWVCRGLIRCTGSSRRWLALHTTFR